MPDNATSENVGLGTEDHEVARLRAYLLRHGYLPARFTKAAPGDMFDKPLADAIALLRSYNGFTPGTAVDAALAAYLAHPRCALPDIVWVGHSPARPLGYAGWARRSLTYRLSRGPTNWDDQSAVTPAAALAYAFGVWASAAGFNFVSVAAPDVPVDVDVRFVMDEHGDGLPFDGPGPPNYAHAFPPPPDDVLAAGLPGDIHFDDAEPWAADHTNGPRSLKILALHEIGHALGLCHSNDRESIMQPCYQWLVQRSAVYALGPEDVRLIRAIYP